MDSFLQLEQVIEVVNLYVCARVCRKGYEILEWEGENLGVEQWPINMAPRPRLRNILGLNGTL